MTQRLQVYRCLICGQIVEVLEVGRGTLVCCGVPMKLQEEQTGGQGAERHLPVVEETPRGIRVRVGPIRHPMEERHFLRWIEARAGNELRRFVVRPGDPPEAEFTGMTPQAKVRAYCVEHGLWAGPP